MPNQIMRNTSPFICIECATTRKRAPMSPRLTLVQGLGTAPYCPRVSRLGFSERF